MTEGEQISHLQIKPPQFTESFSMAWFEILKAQFVFTKITQDFIKYYHALAALSADRVD